MPVGTSTSRIVPLILLAAICLPLPDTAAQTGLSSPSPLAGIRSIRVRVSYGGSQGTPLPDIRQVLRYDATGFIASRLDSLTVDNRSTEHTCRIALSVRQYPAEHPEPVARVLLSYAWVEGRPEQRGSSGPVLWLSEPETVWLADLSDFDRIAVRAIERHLNAFIDAWYRANQPPGP